MTTKKLRVLMEVRPALEGYAGIPQETRLLFRELCATEGIELEGLLVPPFRRLARGTADRWFGRAKTLARKINRYSRVVVSLSDQASASPLGRLAEYLSRRSQMLRISIATILGLSRINLTRFKPQYFEDFVWQTLFAKTLPAADFELVTAKDLRICPVSWDNLQTAGLFSLLTSQYPRYPRLNTGDFDIMIAQTPYPGQVSPSTKLVIRYHDAIPIFLPHTIPRRSRHQAIHFNALMANVRAGAYFACVSEASRQALLRVFPEAAERSVTIHNMVSQQYFPEDSQAERVPQIIRNRLDRESPLKVPKFLSLRESENFYRRALAERPLRYLLVVATVEPRKNHARLFSAWNIIRAETDPSLRLLVVGGLSWGSDLVMQSFRSAIDQGHVFFLGNVPAPELRLLYRHALATVCPSVAEGFDYSGIEAMRSSGIVVASDIPVHREIYEDAAEYFNPYSTQSLVDALRNLLTAPGAALRDHLRNRGSVVSRRFLPDQVMPNWDNFMRRLTLEKHQP